MLNGWGNTSPAGGNGSQQEPVALLVAAQPSTATVWASGLQVDTRFRVSGLANTPEVIQTMLAYNPEAILLDAQLFSGPGPLTRFLVGVQAACYVVVPQGAPEEAINNMRGVPSVKGVFVGAINVVDVAGRIYVDTQSLRTQAPTMKAQWGGTQSAGMAGGLRVIAVWNRSGGVGKSTIAAGLALDAAQRGFKTLLVGLGVPDPLPVMLGLKAEPSISAWLGHPSPEGLQASIQKVGALDVVCGLQDVLREPQLAANPDCPESINKLAFYASYGGYSIIILDTPAAGPAPNAISASNNLVLVARPTFPDAVTSAEAFRVVTKKLAGQHTIGLGNIYTVLNQGRNGLLTSNEWHDAANTLCRNAQLSGFPPIVATIPDVPELPVAANAGRSPLASSDQFARPIHRLGDMLFGSKVGSDVDAAAEATQVIKLGPIRIRKGA